MTKDITARLTGQDKEESAAGLPPALKLDASKYMHELDGFDMSEAQKEELLGTIWSIMRAFVELGFRADICGQLFEGADPALDAPQDGVDLDHSNHQKTPRNGAGKERAP